MWYVPADLNEGYFQVKGSKQDAIVKEQEKLLADIYLELIDPQSFYGTFEEALAKYEKKSKEIACKLGQLPADQCVGVPATHQGRLQRTHQKSPWRSTRRNRLER